MFFNPPPPRGFGGLLEGRTMMDLLLMLEKTENVNVNHNLKFFRPTSL